MCIPDFVLCKSCFMEMPSYQIYCFYCDWNLRAELESRVRRDTVMMEFRQAGRWDCFSWHKRMESKFCGYYLRFLSCISLYKRILPISPFIAAKTMRIRRGKLMCSYGFARWDAFEWLAMKEHTARSEKLNDKYYADTIREGNDGK